MQLTLAVERNPMMINELCLVLAVCNGFVDDGYIDINQE